MKKMACPEVIELAKSYYNSLDVVQGYDLSGWQMDFGGSDWQVEFSKKINTILNLFSKTTFPPYYTANDYKQIFCSETELYAFIS